MTGRGIVVKTDGKYAVVRIRKSSACGHDCGECRVCTNPEFDTEVLNEVGASVGDTVLIGAPTGEILFSAFLVYMAPIFGLIVVYAILSTIFNSALIIAAGCALWIAVWFLMIRRQNSKQKVKPSSILEVINEKN